MILLLTGGKVSLMDRISNNISGQLRTYESYRAKKVATEKNIAGEEKVQKAVTWFMLEFE